ncbi:MAG: aminotransferase class III-fold pyridoxal phosphate-dependent enzyme [Candidatus Omnitrophica bacterium]|nr:aminotransferase class III-fold pyridoxal phosphate-dependent enzyme [Candidatus Omnitrophota bacterium]
MKTEPNAKPSTPPWTCDPSHFKLTEEDQRLFEKELRDFCPIDPFDFHAHWYDLSHLDASNQEIQEPRVGETAYHSCMTRWMGDRAPRRGLFFPFPVRGIDTNKANSFLIEELRANPGSRGLALIHPLDDPARAEEWASDPLISGFKVYHVFADREDTMNAECGEFLPEWAWEIADKHGLCLMLHIVRPRALADQLNLDYIRDRCHRYPGAKLILAHAGRGFCSRHTLEGIGSLRSLDNVFFDTSAICEPQPFQAILETFGPSRLLYGSDFPVCQLRGRALSIGDGFHWLYQHQLPEETWPQGMPTLVGIESLLALKEACRFACLNDSDIERIFRTNAVDLLNLETEEPNPACQAMVARADSVIPGGVQLLSKSADLYAPGQWPAYFREAHGCEVIDLEGRRYIDMTTGGIGACLLGYADPDVNAAVMRRVSLGSVSTLNTSEEVELCEALVKMHPWSKSVRLSRSGGEALAIAIRIARASTGRDKVAFCGYHGWSDWYLAANLADDAALDDHLLPGLPSRGVPRGLEGTAFPFHYNQLDELLELETKTKGSLAAVILEPTRSVDPASGFLEGVREICYRTGAVLIFDEVTTGFRFHRGGVHLKYGIDPDIAVFAKALGNGFPIGAVVGRGEVMKAAETTFISSTSWSEGTGPAAALATLHKMSGIDLPAYVESIGTQFREGLAAIVKEKGIPLQLTGHPALTYLKFDHPQGDVLMTLYTVLLLEQGFLAGSAFYPTWAHHKIHIERFLTLAESVFDQMAEGLERGDWKERIGGPVKRAPFARLT